MDSGFIPFEDYKQNLEEVSEFDIFHTVTRLTLDIHLVVQVHDGVEWLSEEIANGLKSEYEKANDYLALAIQAVKRFGVEPGDLERGPTDDYLAWFSWWNSWWMGLPDFYRKNILQRRKMGEEFPNLKPPGDWRNQFN